MTEHIETDCKKCGQHLRIPKDVGGILMACPACGHKFSSDFKFAGVRKPKDNVGEIFGLPNKILNKILGLFR
ncbi:MAG: hypothetical protein HQL71_02320 [Magnetococcales bacterium]|nr:hypothetical protein [Magnetococcales bacterium]